jgi:glycosyltransferase involved in cell wall biosynthesis
VGELIALPRRIPVLFTAHSLLFQGVGKHPKVLGLFFRRLAAVTAVSHAVGDRHRAELGWGGPIAVIPNGIEPVCVSRDAGARIRSQLSCPKEMFVFLAAGNIRPEKGFEDLLVANAILRSKIGSDAFRVWIAGGVSDRACYSSLTAKIRENKLEKIFMLLGYREDLADLYSAADAFVLSSRSEGLPLVVLEAMSAGLPIIATRVGGVPETVGSCGILCDRGDPIGLAEAMLNSLSDRENLQKMALVGKKRILKLYSRERMLKDYLAAYAQAIG